MSKTENTELNVAIFSAAEALHSFPSIVIIDETDSGNILSDSTRGFDFLLKAPSFNKSLEGFADNYKLQGALADYVMNRFNVKSRGPLLDVGFGENTAFPGRFAEADIPVSGIDVRRSRAWIRNSMMGYLDFDVSRYYRAPHEVDSSATGFRIFDGDIIKMDADNSQLRDQNFGLIIFMGSWSSPGNNFSIEDRQKEVVENRFRKETKQEMVRASVIKKKLKILKTCIGHLENGGMIGIVSSRYAFRGSGYFFEDLPAEKQEFSWLFQQFTNLGANTIYLVGMSRKGFDKVFQIEARPIPTNEYGEEVSAFLDQDKRDEIRAELFEPTGVDGIDSLARIDAIFAEFKAA